MRSIRVSTALVISLATVLVNCGSAPSAGPQVALAPEPQVAPEPTPGPDASEKLAAPAFGSYAHAHAAFDECDQAEPCEVEVTDTLLIADSGAGFVDVVAELTQDNDHGCSFEGRMNSVSPGHWAWTDEAGCHVELKQTAQEFSLSSESCREDYCGARAYLEASFPLSGRLPAPP